MTHVEGWHLARGQNCRFEITDGVFTAIAPAPQAGPRRLILPGLANAHDHVRPISPTSFGGAGKPLETWLLRLLAMPSADPHLAAVAALGRAARGGCVSVMGHYTRWHAGSPSPDEAAAVARAARDVGVRLAFAPALRDMNPLVYGATEPVLAGMPAAMRNEIAPMMLRPPMPVAEQIAMVEACAAVAEGPLVNVHYGLAGVQWCSHALMAAVAEASARTGRRVHMHLLETKYQRAYADQTFPGGVVQHFKDIGLLSPRLTLAHCVYAAPHELDLIAQAGATIVTNASSNLHLRSGIAPIGAAWQRGCRVASGVDASALDEDDDALRELRLGHLLHGGWGFDEIVSRASWLSAITANGRAANGAPGSGALEPGEAADFLVLDLGRLDRDAVMQVDPLDLLFARANASFIDEVFVAGRRIVASGKVTGADLDAAENELRARYRRDLPHKAGFLAAWPGAEAAVAGFCRERLGCC